MIEYEACAIAKRPRQIREVSHGIDTEILVDGRRSDLPASSPARVRVARGRAKHRKERLAAGFRILGGLRDRRRR